MSQELKVEIAKNLLQIKAIKLNVEQPFTWASGWKSPIYCDNRKTYFYPELRRIIAKGFVQTIKQYYPNVEVIAGVATGAIAYGIMVAEEMNLPYVYVRSEPKKHGLENLIEGENPKGKKVVVIEDLLSTGGSSLKVVQALRDAEAEVLGLTAIFTYQFDAAINAFKEKQCDYHTLSNYETLIKTAIEMNYVEQHHLETLSEWRKSPGTWKQE
ncbi:MAG TPA: orotate phosphoribosyltransferase [Bacteroidales bacterium]|nr:orotate phosphoribosyltransferase [Bacteroidales bacterium]HOU98213.1 orotate phosphoribosyltransferase [Bacteroidales bacterium]